MPVKASASSDERRLEDALRGMDDCEVEYLPGQRVRMVRIGDKWFIRWHQDIWMQPVVTLGDVRRLMAKPVEGAPDGTTVTLVVKDGRWHFAHSAASVEPCGPPLVTIAQITGHLRESGAG